MSQNFDRTQVIEDFGLNSIKPLQGLEERFLLLFIRSWRFDRNVD